jgi:hypothetical protein
MYAMPLRKKTLVGSDCPDTSVIAQRPPEHVPEHARPQPPQFAALLVVSTHCPPHVANPGVPA